MPIRILTALLFLIAAPLAMLGWIGFAFIRSEELNAKRQVATLADGRLMELVRSVDEVMSNQHRQIQQQLNQDGALPDRLMTIERSEPHVRSTLWVSARGQLLYPPAPSINTGSEYLLYNELKLIARRKPTLPIGTQRQLSTNIGALVAVESQTQQTSRSPLSESVSQPTIDSTPNKSVELSQEASREEARWHESYFEEGLQLVVWSIRPDGSAIGCWLERARWMSDLIATLPDVDSEQTEGATALVDTNGTVVYRWGSPDIVLENPLAEASLKEPLASWKLRYFVASRNAVATTWLSYWPWAVFLSVVALALLALGAYVAIATWQQLRLASQRVSFVGQVSHELRTPLTNIRLYAEMAKHDLASNEPSLQRIENRLEVIDSESKRLSRMISGVLEFIQGRSKSQPLAWRSVVPDETVRQVLTQCELSLDRCGIVVSTNLNAGHHVEMDSDILEQILINLINNVEKYAVTGKSLWIASSVEGDVLNIEVKDSGPGIPQRFVDRVFKPFFRIDDSITAPSGTGLGLTIARAAAKRHGGGLTLLASDTGAHFRLWLRVRMDTSLQTEARDA